LEERGFHGVGLEEVALEAGVSRQAVYLHFHSKTGLLLALVDHVFKTEAPAELVSGWARASTGLDALEAAIAFHAAYEPRVYRFARVLHAARREEPAADAAWRNRMRARRANYRRVAELLARDGVLIQTWSVKEAADLLWALTSLHMFEYLVIESHWSIQRYKRHLRTVVYRALVKPTAMLNAGNLPPRPAPAGMKVARLPARAGKPG
jgi:AcrR family transcriptional regulator